MKAKKSWRIRIDILLTLVFVLLFSQHIPALSALTHEILGIVIVFAVAAHMLLNWKRLKALVSQLRRGGSPLKSWWILFLAVGLLVLLALTLISGLVVWQRLAGAAMTRELAERQDLRWLVDLHQNASTACIVFIVLHVQVHWQYLRAVFRKQGPA